MKNPPPAAIRLRGIRYPSAAYIPPKVWINDTLLNLEKSLKIRAHSIHGFGWGTDTKGASQLALAICMAMYQADTARLAYPHFKTEFLDGIIEDSFDVKLNVAAFNEAYVGQFV